MLADTIGLGPSTQFTSADLSPRLSTALDVALGAYLRVRARSRFDQPRKSSNSSSRGRDWTRERARL